MAAAVLAFFASAAAVAAEPSSATAALDADFVRTWKFLARFHAVLLHLPIGFLAAVAILELYALLRPSPEARRIIALVLTLTVASGALVAALGLLLGTDGGYDPETLLRHKLLGLAVVAASALAALAHRRGWRGERGSARARWGYRAALVASLVILGLAGHEGGNLTHGSRYLVEYAPRFIQDLVAEAETPAEAAAPAPSPTAPGELSERALAALDRRCASCHGEKKQKGGYRLDRFEEIFKAGESGEAAVVPGDPHASQLVRLILLPGKDSDAMPPKGKERLSAEETLDVIHWIQAGAQRPSRAAEPPAASPAAAGQ